MKYIFGAGLQRAITTDPMGANLPPPAAGSWMFDRVVLDVSLHGVMGFDASEFAKQGYQLLSRGGVRQRPFLDRLLHRHNEEGDDLRAG
jgi:hypothetical protein